MLLLKLLDDGGNIFGAKDLLLGEKSRQQEPIAEGVDATRNAAAGGIDRMKRFGFDTRRLALPVHMRKPVFDIGLRLFAVERPQVVGGDDPLTQLLHLRALHHLP